MLTFLDARKVTTLKKGLKKKLRPSKVRRNLKRKEDFLKLKSENAMTVQPQQKMKTFTCNPCKSLFKMENDLNIQMDTMHNRENFSENIKQLDGYASLLSNSSTKGTGRSRKIRI